MNIFLESSGCERVRKQEGEPSERKKCEKWEYKDTKESAVWNDPSGSSDHAGWRSTMVKASRLPSSIGIFRGEARQQRDGDRRRYQDRRRRRRHCVQRQREQQQQQQQQQQHRKVSARCTSSGRWEGGAAERVLRGRCARYPVGRRRRGVRQPDGVSGVCTSLSSSGKLEQLVASTGALPVGEEPPRNPSCSSSAACRYSEASARRRRVGIVENHYSTSTTTTSSSSEAFTAGGVVAGNQAGGERIVREREGRAVGGEEAVCELVRGLERLLGESERMKSKKQQEAGVASEAVDPSEANESYDEFDAARMPVVRALSKSPQSDEGIETDTERRRGSIARCWSIDSTAASDEDASAVLAHQHVSRHKLRVTRCCSSDSAVLSDEDQIKGWDSTSTVEANDAEHPEGRPRYWRTPSVVVSDYSDYSYLDETLERNDLDLEKYDATSGTPSQASSCSCLDCDEIRESLDRQFLQVCWNRRHSDSCCLCLDSTNATSIRNLTETGNRRNSCLESSRPFYSKYDSQLLRYSQDTSSDLQEKGKIEFLEIPPARKISDCSTTSSLSGDECDVNELQDVKPARSSGWRKLRNIVHWTPFFQTYKKQRYPWVQLAGHQGNFRAGPTPGTILKKLCPQEEACFRLLMNDILKPYVPEFKGVLDIKETEETNSEETSTRDTLQKENTEETGNKRIVVSSYLQLQDLLGDFEHPCVMDCKVGVRTYLESELAKAKERPKLRKDMYEKMVQVDPSAPFVEERKMQGVTKPRYMVWRETISSTATLGFRVEGIKLAHGGSSKDFKTTRTREQVTEVLRRFVEGYDHAVPKYLQRLKTIRTTLGSSPFFASHEVVGSSLLFVHDAKNAGVWMIDFAKTLPLPPHLPRIRHDAEWQVGNHEDGYLIGVNNLIDIFQDIRNSET